MSPSKIINATTMFNLEDTPYILDISSSKQVKNRLNAIEERVSLLRNQGYLSPETIKNYYGEKRFEQVAESNAIEGSTLSAGETELAVLKGMTITGHDPAFVKDAMSLDRALTRITELARDVIHPTNISQLSEIHSLILGDRPGAGVFRSERVTIRGARHSPPKTWKEIMDMMEKWQSWSAENSSLPAPIRATIMHAWLTHIHPYIDGNGRTSRAIGNLELIRAGYPPIIIKKKEREHYIQALAESDEGGDIRMFMELIFDRIEGALTGLELSARQQQGYSPFAEKIKKQQENQLQIWKTSVELLASIIQHKASQLLSSTGGICEIKQYDSLDLEEYVSLCNRDSVPKSWAFTLNIDIPSRPKLEKLVFIGHRSPQMYQHLNKTGGPSLYWAIKNSDNFPKWIADDHFPFATEITCDLGNGDQWIVKMPDNTIKKLQTTELASKIINHLITI